MLILVIDDHAINLKLAQILLKQEGYQVQTATNAVEAKKIIRAHKPQMILMDIQLPGMDGLEFTRQLKSDANYRDIIIVALTAYAMKGDEEKAKAAGCDGYITKPIDPLTLPATIAKYFTT